MFDMAGNYSVDRSVRSGTDIFRLEQADGAFAEIAPDWGNNCFVFHATTDVLESVPIEKFAQRPQSYGIPILFPYPNRINDGKFTYAGKTYEVNPKQHGFVRDKKWRVLDNGSSDSEGAWIRSEFDAANYPREILDQFPFPFALEVLYRLRKGRLTMETVVRNTGENVLPFGFAIHPYFQLPKSGTISIPAEKRWELKDMIPTGRRLHVEGQYDLRQPRDVHTLSLDDIFTDLLPKDQLIRCVLQDNAKGVRTIVEFDAHEFPDVVVYNVPSPRRAICMEPYTCPTDAFNLQNSGIDANVLELPKNGEMKFRIAIYTEGQ
jgi:aldose 1-epimerase